jgi:hypothetical protein
MLIEDTARFIISWLLVLPSPEGCGCATRKAKLIRFMLHFAGRNYIRNGRIVHGQRTTASVSS